MGESTKNTGSPFLHFKMQELPAEESTFVKENRAHEDTLGRSKRQ